MSTVVHSIGILFSGGQFPPSSEPDKAPQFFGKPSPDFVLCRDESGSATAVYGEPVWDFNPYRLSANKVSRIRFDRVFGERGQEQQELIEEVKHVLYCIIYFVTKVLKYYVNTYFISLCLRDFVATSQSYNLHHTKLILVVVSNQFLHHLQSVFL